MSILVFDTETTGLLPKGKSLKNDVLHLFPHIVQFSYIIYEIKSNQIIKMRDFIIKLPSEVTISTESIKIHGITNEISQREGVNIENVIDEFIEDFTKVNMIVAHNISFDLMVLRADIMRMMGTSDIYTEFEKSLNVSKKLYCTMQESIDVCNIKAYYKDGREYVKFPKLSELHEKLFQTIPQNLHNSMNDVIVCLRCFYKMNHDIDILTVNEELSELYNKLLK